jgi:hypothetical protein
MESSPMNQMSVRIRHSLVGAAASLLIAVATLAPCDAQSNAPVQVLGVDSTQMGAYRALAQLSFQAFQKGNYEMAAKLAYILERTWDRSEEGDSSKTLINVDKHLFEKIDAAMDAFIKPVMNYTAKAPEAASVTAAYNAFLEVLKQADNK